MKFSILIIAALAVVLLVSGCSKKVEPVPTSNVPVPNTATDNTAGVSDAGAADVGTVTVDNPTDPGTLDNVPVSDSVPQ